MTFADAKQRFSNRAADYVRYRPGYPPELLDVLRKECDLRPGHVIADIGSGTGFLSELFLKNGNAVFGVEPNREMREAGELHLQSYRAFVSVEGSAEATTLPEACADFVAAGQAFHWFEPEKTRAEFRRILRPQGWVVAIWNFREMETPFARAYEEILVKYGTDYTRVRDSYPQSHDVQSFFSRRGIPASHPAERTILGLGRARRAAAPRLVRSAGRSCQFRPDDGRAARTLSQVSGKWPRASGVRHAPLCRAAAKGTE